MFKIPQPGKTILSAWEKRHHGVASRIESSALALFAKSDASNVTTDQIAAAAGISRRTFYRYFQSSTDILCATFRRNLEIWAHEFRKQPLDEPLITSLYTAIVRALEFSEDIANVRLALTALDKSPAATKSVRAEMTDYISRLYLELITQRLQARGEGTRSARAIAAALTAIMIEVAEDCAREGTSIDPDKIDYTLTTLASLFAEYGAFSSSMESAV